MNCIIQCRLKKLVFVFSLIFMCLAAYSQADKPALYFYAAPASSSSPEDPAAVKMTRDLLFSQLSSLDLFIIRDKRDTEYSPDLIKKHAANDFLFYAEIYEKNGEWLSKMHLIEAASAKETVLQNSYEGYYKILMEAKSSLTALIKQFNTGNTSSAPQEIPAQPAAATGNISGTWFGENHIDKIVLLRGGRGFVIFKNGASMNISVSIDGNTVTAVQQSKPDASFFPDIPRETALIKAPDAAPIRWELTIKNDSLMQGVKSGLVAEYDAAGVLSVREGSTPVEWHR
ncbi:MAG: TP0183 family DNA metabolism protein [Treponema sp.]|uniref:TP0183 family DNA metabolism protein n=1 Tax=Treponema sp. TaxID=166 RepID=UPI003FA3155D